jgi:hypothetical protein
VVDQNRFRHVERVELPGGRVFAKFFHRELTPVIGKRMDYNSGILSRFYNFVQIADSAGSNSKG